VIGKIYNDRKVLFTRLWRESFSTSTEVTHRTSLCSGGIELSAVGLRISANKNFISLWPIADS
jgi:hypothetical protein